VNAVAAKMPQAHVNRMAKKSLIEKPLIRIHADAESFSDTSSPAISAW
jgi:hypothetical protein